MSLLSFFFGVKWRKSDPHLLLLSKFLSPRPLDSFEGSQEWAKVLGESPLVAIVRFQTEGMLKPADILSRLDYKFRVQDLKGIMAKRGISTSGRKAELIQRLREAMPDDAKQLTTDVNVYTCSTEGSAIANSYLARQEEHRSRAERQVATNLEKRKLKTACLVMANFEATQVFPRGIGVNWRRYDPSRDLTVLKNLFSGMPKLLVRYGERTIESIRVASAMSHLWGSSDETKWLPDEIKKDSTFDLEVAVRMLTFYGIHRTQLEQYKTSGAVNRVEILTTKDSCEACKKLARKKFRLQDAPELPFESCTHRLGCRCTFIADVSDGQ